MEGLGPFNILSLEMIILKRGIKCNRAFNGRQAIEFLIKNYNKEKKLGYTAGEPNHSASLIDVRMIFMDLMMPVMNGIECTTALTKLMQDGILPIIPIYGCSANDSSKYIKECMAAGMSGFVAKPLTLNKVNEILNLYFLK